jgi:3-oxoacyl-[acyl-carrier-protein] synthase II
MSERSEARDGGPPAVVITGVSAATAFGRGTGALLDAVCAGRSAFRPVSRFDVSGLRARHAALMDQPGNLIDELAAVVDEACEAAGLSAAQRADCPLLLAAHADPALLRSTDAQAPLAGAAASAVELSRRCATGAALRTYTTGCVAASTALIDAAVMIRAGRAERVVVAAGYLVDADYFATFDAGRALAPSGWVRPFGVGRDGMLLGDAAVAVVVESPAAARQRGVPGLATLVGWGSAGDAYHVCQPDPNGRGLARAISAALDRSGLTPERIGYVNAHGSGTAHSDVAEAAALRQALGAHASRVPVSSTKSTHGHTLEAAALLEFVITVLALRLGRLPVNAGVTEPDATCGLNLVLDPTSTSSRYALSVNAAFGGANTALVVRADD